MGLFDDYLRRQREELENLVVELRGEIAAFKATREAEQRLYDLQAQATELKTKIEDMRLAKDRLTEEHAREKREVEHLVGLERKRQEFEAEQAKKDVETAKRDATLAVREENLKSEREAFKKEMDFREKRFVQEVGYLKELMGQILERLPTVTVERVDKTTHTTRS